MPRYVQTCPNHRYNRCLRVIILATFTDLSLYLSFLFLLFVYFFVPKEIKDDNLGTSFVSRPALLPTSAGGAPVKTSDMLNPTLRLLNYQTYHLVGIVHYIARTMKDRSPCLAQSPFPNRRTSAGCRRPTIHHRTSVGRKHAGPSSLRISVSMSLSGSGKRSFIHMSSRSSREQIYSSRV